MLWRDPTGDVDHPVYREEGETEKHLALADGEAQQTELVWLHVWDRHPQVDVSGKSLFASSVSCC